MATESALKQLEKFSTVVADTGVFEQLARINPPPRDATTSPSLIPKAAKDPNYQRLIIDAIEYAKQKLAHGTPEEVCTCVQAKVTLISPFVGHILDWHVKNTDKKEFTRDTGPGVQSVRHIYRYNKKHEHIF